MVWNARVAKKSIIIRDAAYVVFEVKYLWSRRVRKDEVNANLI